MVQYVDKKVSGWGRLREKSDAPICLFCIFFVNQWKKRYNAKNMNFPTAFIKICISKLFNLEAYFPKG